MNNVFIYSGGFYELIKLINLIIKNDYEVANISNKETYQITLFDNLIELDLEGEDYINFLNKFSYRVKKMCFYIFLSNNSMKDLTIYYFLRNALIYHDKVFYLRNLNCVNKAYELSCYVRRETHKFKGFMRFKKMKGNFYYAEFSPTNNIIFLVAQHFKRRLASEYFIIKDVKRNIYACFNKKNILFFYEESNIRKNFVDDDEELFQQELWKSFFKTIGINERKNKKVQINFMPKKYWEYIIEMENEK